MTDDAKPVPVDRLLTRAKRTLEKRGTSSALTALMQELVAALEDAGKREEEIRREAFLEGVRGAAKVVREKKEALRAAADRQAAQGDEGGIHDEVAGHILEVAQEGPVTLKTLRDLLARTESASGDLTALDEALVRTYYALVNRHRPTAADVLPIGRPTASLDVALAMAARLLPEGWWSLGATFAPDGDRPTALVGAAANHDPKPKTGASPQLALLSAMLTSLIEDTGSKQ